MPPGPESRQEMNSPALGYQFREGYNYCSHDRVNSVIFCYLRSECYDEMYCIFSWCLSNKGEEI